MDKQEALNILKQMKYNEEMKANGFNGVNVKFEKQAEALEIAIKEMEESKCK